MKNPGNRRWLRPAELARRKGVAVSTVIEHIRMGLIHATPRRVSKSGKPSGYEISRAEVARYCDDPRGLSFGDPSHPFDIHKRQRSVA